MQGTKGTQLAHSRAAGAGFRAAQEPDLLGSPRGTAPGTGQANPVSDDLHVPGSLQDGALCPSSSIFFSRLGIFHIIVNVSFPPRVIWLGLSGTS